MRPRILADLVSVDLPDDELVVSNSNTSQAVILNAIGSAVLDLCDGARTGEDIADFICVHLAGAEPDRVRTDVQDLLSRLIEAGVVEDIDSC